MQYIWSFREREVAVAVVSLLCEGCLELVIEQLLQEVSHSANASVTSPLQELSVRDRGLVGGGRSYLPKRWCQSNGRGVGLITELMNERTTGHVE